MNVRRIATLIGLVALPWTASGSFFTLVPASGALTITAGSTVGLGYSISNTSTDWLVPIGLLLTNPADGSLVDIFDYPSVAPGDTVALGYVFSQPGGPGNSSGLVEYTVPANVPAGSAETGSIALQYQLYSGDPDTNPNANPIGPSATFVPASFEFNVAPPVTSPVPESGTLKLSFAVCISLLIVRRRVSELSSERADKRR